MKYVKYPGTDKVVSSVGFGGLRFDKSKTNEENAKLIIYAYEKGINYFDTAPGYVDDRSEDIIGTAIRELHAQGKNDFYVSTKGKPMVYDTKEKAIEAVKRSIKRLGVEKIDFYNVWGLKNLVQYDACMSDGGQYEGLLECQSQGLIDHIVFSSHQPGDEVKRVLDEGKFQGVTMGINILNYNYRWDGIQYAYDKVYGIVAMNPLSGGTIPLHEEELAFLAKDGETPTEGALRFNINSPEITVSLIGFNSNEEIDMACKIADENKIFTKEDREELLKHFSCVTSEMCTGCSYCKVCPQEINVPAYMLMYNEKQMFGKSDEQMKEMVYGLEYWNYTANTIGHAKDCIDCKACETQCTQSLPIISRLKEFAKWEEEKEDTYQKL